VEGDLHIAVTVNGSPLEPRLPLRAVPFARQAADSASLGGFGADAYLQTADLNAADGIAVDGSNLSLAEGGVRLEHLGSAVAVKQTSGQNTGSRLLVVKKPQPCGGGIDVIEDTGPGILEYSCSTLPCGVDGSGVLLYQGSCSTNTCTSGTPLVRTSPGTCSITLRTTVAGASGALRDIDDVIGQLVAVEER